MEPKIGKLYRWPQVQHWGGEQCFLAKRSGHIVCATLVKKHNPGAPGVMFVGIKKRNIQRAKEFCEQKEPIPVFIGEGNEWRYVGRYVYARTATPKEVKEY